MERLQGLHGERGSENLFYTMYIYILTNTVNGSLGGTLGETKCKGTTRFGIRSRL